MTLRHLLYALLAALVLGLAACGDEQTADDAGQAEQDDDGGALGGGAETRTLAQLEDVATPDAEAVWSAHEVTLPPGEELTHEHPMATVYAHDGDHRLTTGDGDTTLAAGDGAAVPAGVTHTHAAPDDEPSVFWEIVLAEAGAELPGAPDAERLFESEPLEGMPESPRMQFIEVRLPPGTATTVHTHPGPEFIYGTEGRFDYENEIEGAREFGPGDVSGIPPDTAVQKRNETGEDAVFLSWFLVDPDEPFAPGAEFAGD